MPAGRPPNNPFASVSVGARRATWLHVVAGGGCVQDGFQ